MVGSCITHSVDACHPNGSVSSAWRSGQRYPEVALCRHTSYRDSHWGETTQRRSIIRSTRTLAIRQGHGFDRSTAALLAAPSRYHYTLTSFLFRRPAGPKRQRSLSPICDSPWMAGGSPTRYSKLTVFSLAAYAAASHTPQAVRYPARACWQVQVRYSLSYQEIR